MASDRLSDELRDAATRLSDDLGGSVTAAESAHLMRMAADALEGYEAAEHERLEHEAVTPEILGKLIGPDGAETPVASGPVSAWNDHEGWELVGGVPLFPMREQYGSDAEHTLAVVAWVRLLNETES